MDKDIYGVAGPRLKMHKFLLACYALSVSRLVSHILLFYENYSLTLLLLPKWFIDLKYGPYPPAGDSTLAAVYTALLAFRIVKKIFVAGNATYRPLCRSVGWSVGLSHITPSERTAITAPAQPPATGLPFIRPCLLTSRTEFGL